VRRLFALLVVGALVLGVIYYWKYKPGQLPQFRTEKLDSVGNKLDSVGSKLSEVGQQVSEKFRSTKVTGAVKAALELNRNLSGYPIEVNGHDDGSVILKGEVPSEEARATAARVAAAVPDVAHVDNQIRVNSSLAAPPADGRSLGENFDDHALDAKVKLAYSLNREMKGSDVSVSSFKREIALSGTVASDAQRQLAVQIAQQTPQVAAVKDGLQVGGAAAAPAAAGPDGNPGRARAVEAALAANPNLSSFGLKVEARNGELVLSGRVRTGAEKDLAGVVARDAANGTVQNNVIVQP
jgi:hyperosmotically inducible periplasmic protein